MNGRTWIRRGSVTALILVGIAITAIFYLRSRSAQAGEEGGWRSKVLWRASLYARKATGGLRDLSWSELWQMTRHGDAFGMQIVVVENRGLEGGVTNPFVREADRSAGARIFGERCAVCHGAEGTGWHGPPLNRPGLRHGDSDFAIYRVVRDGIAGTPMPALPLSFSERWQLVGYLKGLQIRSPGWNIDAATRLNIEVTSQDLQTASSRPDRWLTYSGSLDGHRYSTLSEITPSNASQLRIRWIRQFETNEPTIEATPLVVDGVIFTTEPPSNVVALDAKTGKVNWRYARGIPADLPVCCGRVNRGLAILGHSLFLASLDGSLVALNANTGEIVWEVRVADPSHGFTLTGAPLIIKDSVVVGVAGGEYGIRGFLAAYDAASGQQRWSFSTVPGPGEFGHETWQNDAWKTGGGPTWITGSYDPSLDLLYWGVGNPSPDFSSDVRPGDNLFTGSVVALHGQSGKLAWHFQFSPHDEHDWDSNQTPILADITVGGVPHAAICWFNRNGFYYVLDRVTGKFLAGAPFVEQNWTKGLDSNGRPIPLDAGEVSRIGRLTKPGIAGGTNWQNPAFDRRSGLVFVPATEGASVFTKSDSPRRGDQGVYVASAGSMPEPPISIVRALDVATGARKWERSSPLPKQVPFKYGGLLATGGGLVFGAAGGSFFALDSATGQQVWSVFLGGDTAAAPITFSLDGHQVVALSAGRALFLFGL
jgi:alcohol dehydrogenase (cytochrome c)